MSGIIMMDDEQIGQFSKRGMPILRFGEEGKLTQEDAIASLNACKNADVSRNSRLPTARALAMKNKLKQKLETKEPEPQPQKVCSCGRKYASKSGLRRHRKKHKCPPLPTITYPKQKLSLEELQKLVGGFIELIYFSDGTQKMYINEEGKNLNLPLNPQASELVGQRIVGNVVVVDSHNDEDSDDEWA